MEMNKLQTPYYILDEAECVSRGISIKDEVSAWGGKICYAIKANPFLIPSFLSVVDKFEVCSPGELEICRRYHVPGDKILFSGVVKTKEDIKTALEYPVDVITLESLEHWKNLKECMHDQEELPEAARTVKIMPRLSSGAQFGMGEEQLFQIVEEQLSMENIKLEGIHYFTGTQKKGNKYEKELETAALFLDTIKERYKLDGLILEYGPGLAVPYFTGDDFSAPLELIKALRNYIETRKFSFRIDIELGRYMAASCGKYVASIVDVKEAQERAYCLINGGIHHVNYYGSNMAMRTPVIKHVKGNENSQIEAVKREYMICGALCTFADILARGVVLEEPEVGDMLIFENVGAYSITESSYLFLSRDLPGIYLQKASGEIVELRSKISSYEINSCQRQEKK